MARIVGLDIGARWVKALKLESSFRGFAVSGFAQVKVEGEGGVKAALASLRQGGHLAGDQVVVAVPGCAVATHLIAMPFADPRRIEATLGFEVEGQLPYDLAEVTYDWQVLQTKDGKSDVLVGTARNEELANLLALLAEVGVDPRVITTSALAYQPLLAQRLLGDARPAPDQGAEAILDIGHERTSICVTGPGGLEYARTFALGGKELTRAIANEFKVSFVDAEAWKDNEADVALGPDTPAEVERAAGALLRGLAPLLRELRATLRAHSARFRTPLARIYLAGGTAKLKGLDALLARELSVEVKRLEPVPPEGAQALGEGAHPGGALAFALAIRGHGAARAARFNLRKGAFAFKGDLDYLKGKASRLAAFAAVLTLLSAVLIWAQFRALSARESAYDSVLCQLTSKVLNQCQKDYLVALSILKGKSSPVASIPVYSALDLFSELAVRAQSVKVKLEETEVQLDRVRLRGETESFEGVDQLVGALKGFKCFQEIKRGKVQKDKSGAKVLFDLDIRVQCEGAGRTET
jgi:general secretion pathway protein L